MGAFHFFHDTIHLKARLRLTSGDYAPWLAAGSRS
jgi:hypothetical protein